MSKCVVKILNCLLLFITGIACIGVNITKLSCCHSDRVHWEVKMVPVEMECPCHEDCCPQDCHDQTRHDFYKITEASRVEQIIQLETVVLYLPVGFLQFLPKFFLEPANDFAFRHEIPDMYFPRELLCTYLC